MIKEYVERMSGRFDINDLLDIVALLRSENGCQWDKVQTHQSIRSSLIEETYEAADAIDKSDVPALKEELGDVLLQVVFHAQIEREKDSFTFDDVCDGICRKLITRHPHVFGEVKADTPDEVLKNWDEIKMAEKSQKTYSDTLLSVPDAFPALMRAQKIQKRAAKAGYDFKTPADAMDKLCEELDELKEAIATDGNSDILDETGDLLFSAVNISRLLGIDAEEALGRSSDKFVKRFCSTENMALKSGKALSDMSDEDRDRLWEAAKEVL